MKFWRIVWRIVYSILFAAQTTVGLAAILVLALLATMAMRSAPDVAYRDRDCAAPQIDPRLTLAIHVDDQLGDHWDCRREEFVIGGSDQAFSLNFLEFREDGHPAGITLTDGRSAQLADFERLLETDEKSYVLVFVHGWRNNASRYNYDLHKFRVLLAYAAAFVNQRCDAQDTTYCGMNVRGLYVGWRGASFNERDDEGKAMPDMVASLLAAPTFMARKSVTDGDLAGNTTSTLPAALAAALRAVEDRLALRDAAGTGSDRMIVLGHSLGANLLLQAFKGDLIDAATRHQSGSILQSVIGDLLVLINPAATATDWIEVAQSVRDATQVPAADRFTDTSQRFFPAGQPPTVIALTATCPFYVRTFPRWQDYWQSYFEQLRAALTDSLDPACDWVTAFALPLAQMLGGHTEDLDRIALGQLVPVARTSIAGLTHGLETNTSVGATSYSGSGIEKFNGCAEVPGWLLAARRRAAEKDLGWDAGSRLDGPEANLSPVRLPDVAWPKGLNVQFALEADIYRGRTERRHRIDGIQITGRNDPFWNVAAHANTIEHHGGYVSYQLWCALNQFVLDDTTSRFPPPEALP